MVSAAGVRIGWADLPAEIRCVVESVLGGAVVEAVSQVGGFSPGTADRVRTADGRRAFVKAVSAEQNPHTPILHRGEAAVMAAMPGWAPVPKLLGYHDDGRWVALVLEDIDGRHPKTPWQHDDLGRVLAMLDDFAAQATPSPVPNLSTAAESFADDFAGWRRIAADPPPDLHPWTARHLDELCASAERGLATLAGDTLLHTDLRADNIMLSTDGAIALVDWPWACRGPSWLDTLFLLINVRLYGGHDTSALLTERANRYGAARDDLLAVLAAAAGRFTDLARQPPPPGLPTVRAFQRAQADALLSWLREETTPTGLPI